MTDALKLKTEPVIIKPPLSQNQRMRHQEVYSTVGKLMRLPRYKRQELLAEAEKPGPKFREFRPSAKQRAFWEALISSPPGANLSKAALAKRTNTSYSLILNWHKDERFLQWLDVQRSRVAEEKLDAVWKAMYDKAVEGNVPAARLFVERFDKDYKPVIKNETDVTHHLPELTDDQQGELERARLNFQQHLTLPNNRGENYE